jgi:cobaltochelatase CobN
MGEQLLVKFLGEEGRFPESIGITLWSSDVFRAEGELIGQILWLLGCEPKWGTGDRVQGLVVMPESDLTMIDGSGKPTSRPRIDVLVQMSGIVRDTLPVFYEMIDDAVGKVAGLDEPDRVNYVRKHISEQLKNLQSSLNNKDESSLRRLAGMRVFSSKPGSFGVGVNLALDASAWNDDTDLAEAFINWTGYAYGKGTDSTSAQMETASLEQYAKLIRSLDVAYQKAAAAEYDALSCGSYSGFQGGMAATKRGLGGGETKLYWGDSVTSDVPEVRDLAEEIELGFSAQLLNPDWVEVQKRQDYQGSSKVATMVNAAYAWSATSRVVTKDQFDGICRVYIEDEENRLWLTNSNIYALEEITRRLLEAQARGLWQADDEQLEAVRETVLSIEGDLEERMGPVQGELQGGSVDIITRDEVEAWDYKFQVKR